MDALPPLNAIRAFDAAARAGSFAKAAAELHVTHWAVGKQIRLLQDWMGFPLFRRRPRQVVLTDEGAELAREVSSALSTLSAAAKRLRNSETIDRASGTVRITISLVASTVPKDITGFSNKPPRANQRSARYGRCSRLARKVGLACSRERPFGREAPYQPEQSIRARHP